MPLIALKVTARGPKLIIPYDGVHAACLVLGVAGHCVYTTAIGGPRVSDPAKAVDAFCARLVAAGAIGNVAELFFTPHRWGRKGKCVYYDSYSGAAVPPEADVEAGACTCLNRCQRHCCQWLTAKCLVTVGLPDDVKKRIGDTSRAVAPDPAECAKLPPAIVAVGVSGERQPVGANLVRTLPSGAKCPDGVCVWKGRIKTDVFVGGVPERYTIVVCDRHGNPLCQGGTLTVDSALHERAAALVDAARETGDPEAIDAAASFERKAKRYCDIGLTMSPETVARVFQNYPVLWVRVRPVVGPFSPAQCRPGRKPCPVEATELRVPLPGMATLLNPRKPCRGTWPDVLELFPLVFSEAHLISRALGAIVMHDDLVDPVERQSAGTESGGESRPKRPRIQKPDGPCSRVYLLLPGKIAPMYFGKVRSGEIQTLVTLSLLVEKQTAPDVKWNPDTGAPFGGSYDDLRTSVGALEAKGASCDELWRCAPLPGRLVPRTGFV